MAYGYSIKAVVPSDTVAIYGKQWLRIGSGGTLSLKGVSDPAAVTLSVTTGEYVPFTAGYVMSTGTTATGIVAIDL
jgi:hypothetical protein